MLEYLSGLITHFISAGGYPGIFLLMMLESALIPVPSEITMPFAGFLAQQGHLSLLIVILVGALANTVGSLLAYALGYYLEEHVILALVDKYGKYILFSKHEYERSLSWFTKYGNTVVFFSRLLPGVRTFISLPAGLAEMNVVKFTAYTFTGSLIWSALLAYVGYYMGKNWHNIHNYMSKLEYLIVAVAIIGVLYYLNTKFKIFPLGKKK